MSIDIINKYRERTAIKNSSCIIKKKSNEFFNLLYIATKATKEEIDILLKTRELPITIITSLISENIITNKKEIEEVLYYGDLNLFTNYKRLVYQFPLRKIDIVNRKEPQFRLYSRTLEYQKSMMFTINLCPTSELSWKSVIDKVGNSTGLILKIRNKKQ